MTFNPDFNTLPKAQRRLWEDLAPAKELGFCLYGGTALALRYGHRESVDFDFFSDAKLNKSLLMSHLPILKNAIPLQETPNTLVVLVSSQKGKDAVRISFFGDISFGRVGIPEFSSDGVLLAASVKDLMATKLKVLFDRIEPKDYFDIAEMLRHGTSLNEGICDALALFPLFSPGYCLKTLCHFTPHELASLDLKCKNILVEAARDVSSNTKKFAPSTIVSPSLVLSPNETVAELSIIQAGIPPSKK